MLSGQTCRPDGCGGGDEGIKLTPNRELDKSPISMIVHELAPEMHRKVGIHSTNILLANCKATEQAGSPVGCLPERLAG
jgi:hypothetical protein